MPSPSIAAYRIEQFVRDHNGAASFQMVAYVLDVEGVARQDKAGLLSNDKVRKDFEALRATIKSGGK